MTSKQFKTYCKIMDYVDSKDPELSALLRGTCSSMSLDSSKGKPGVTLLLPQDKAFRAKLEKLAYSDKTEDATKAANMLSALIIRDVFKTPADWKAKEASNSLWPSQIVEVATTSASEVTFKSGAKAVLDTEFKDASRRGNLAVWLLVSGEIPVTEDKPATMRSARPKGKVGAYDTGKTNQTLRFNIALAVENTYALYRQQLGKASAKCRDIYLEHSMSLVNYIMTVRKDNALMCEKVIPVISFDKIDFYVLLEPHKPEAPYLLDDDLINEWWAQRALHAVSPVQVIKEVEKQLLGQVGSSMVFTDRAKIWELLAGIRKKISQMADSRPRQIVEEIAKVYDELDDHNTIGGVGPIYSDSLHAYYAANKGLKMAQDELRYLTHGSFRNIESRPFDFGAFHELTNMIGEVLYATSAARAGTHKLLNKNAIKYLISPTENVYEIKIFLNSTLFMFVPMTSAEASNLKYKYSVARPDPTTSVLFNIAKDVYDQHQRLLPEPAESSAFITALLSLNVELLDPILKEELRKKFT